MGSVTENGSVDTGFVSSDDIINPRNAVIYGHSLQQSDEIYLPLSIFRTDKLSSFEAIVKYMKENLSLRYCEIAGIVGRDDRTIWNTYSSATQKMTEGFELLDSDLSFPCSSIHDRAFSVLESITVYLKEERNLRYCKIASLLNRDARTIWTIYARAKKKRKNADKL